MATTLPSSELLLVRQPIHDSALRVAAYELVNQRDGSSEQESSSVISELGLSLTAGQLAYIPASRPFLVDGYALALPADRVVLKVRGDVGLDELGTSALRELVGRGYSLALDSFVVGGPAQHLLELADVVGIDVRAYDRAIVRSQVAALRGRGVRLLAQNVDDHETLEFCRAEGFDLFQGYFFCTPRVVPGQRVQVNVLNRMRLAAALQSPDVQLDELETIITRDVGLSYNLLRFINSAFFSLPRRVESIKDALVLLGVANVRRWATLMAIVDADDKPRELVVTGLVRARMCELLADAYGHGDGDGFFTTGLFSVVDALTDTSMIELLASMPLSEEIIKALLNHEGAKGRALHAVIAYERANFAEIRDLPPTGAPLSELYARAVEWASDAGGVVRP